MMRHTQRNRLYIRKQYSNVMLDSCVQLMVAGLSCCHDVALKRQTSHATLDEIAAIADYRRRLWIDKHLIDCIVAPPQVWTTSHQLNRLIFYKFIVKPLNTAPMDV